MPPSNQTILAANSERGSPTMEIACELHGCDPRQLSPEKQIIAIEKAASYGGEELVDTLIALLPLHLRATACRNWDLAQQR